MTAEPIAPPLPLDGADREVAKRTYFYDRLRGFFYGLLEPGWVTFSLIIAIRYYDMPDYLRRCCRRRGSPRSSSRRPVCLRR